MPVSSTPSDGFTSGAQTSLTISHTSDTNPLYVFLSWYVVSGGLESADLVTGVTFNGVALTRGGHSAVAGNTMEWWWLDEPDSGSHNVVISLSAARRTSAGVLNMTGWPATIDGHIFESAGAEHNPPSVIIASHADSEVFSWIGFNDPSQNVTAPTGSTEQWNQEGEGGGIGAGGDQVSAGAIQDGAATVTVTWAGTVTAEFFGVAALSFRGSRNNLLTGESHTVEGRDNLIVGAGGTVTGDINALFALCADSPAPAITGDRTFKVCADSIELDAVNVLINGVSVGASGVVQAATVTLTNADILSLNSTPKTIVSAPGSGYAVFPVAIYNSTDFSAGVYSNNTCRLRHAGGTTELVTPWATFLNQSAVRGNMLPMIATGLTASEFTNKDLQVSTNANPTGGNAANQWICTVLYITMAVL